jgi:hypothetical protein
MKTDVELQAKYRSLMGHLNERERRLVAAADARALGYGGLSRVSRASGLSRQTLHEATAELVGRRAPAPRERVRRQGAGRKRVVEEQPGLVVELERLVDPVTRGDPMSPLLWTCQSTRQLAQALAQKGFRVSHVVVAELLHAWGYSLQANSKTLEGSHHADRDAQFRYLNAAVVEHLAADQPVISVDTKKKELVGNFKNGGREWHPQGDPVKVNDHDFPDPELGKAIPYGIYDVGRNLGWVSVGCDHDTASFAVQSLGRWWQSMGRELYPQAERLLICADSGGSNGARLRLWKKELQGFVDRTGLAVTVCHLPPGTSKWNKIEHRLFSHISMNWRGRPLTSHEVVVQLIGAVTTRTGLRVRAELDREKYPTKVVVSDEELAAIHLDRHAFHGDWNYTIRPRSPSPALA